MNASSEVKRMPLCDIENLKMSQSTKERLTTLLLSAARSDSPEVVKYLLLQSSVVLVFSGLIRYGCPFDRVIVSFQDSSLFTDSSVPMYTSSA